MPTLVEVFIVILLVFLIVLVGGNMISDSLTPKSNPGFDVANSIMVGFYTSLSMSGTDPTTEQCNVLMALTQNTMDQQNSLPPGALNSEQTSALKAVMTDIQSYIVSKCT